MTSIQMPQLGETIVEGTILKWLKAEGETIERDEPLFEISTDKVDTEVPSPVAGTVTKILVAEGETVPVGTELAEIASGEDATAGGGAPAGAAATSAAPSSPREGGEPGGGAPDQLASDASAAPASVRATVPAGAGAMPDRGPRSQILSPLVRKLAQEHGIDLSTIRRDRDRWTDHEGRRDGRRGVGGRRGTGTRAERCAGSGGSAVGRGGRGRGRDGRADVAHPEGDRLPHARVGERDGSSVDDGGGRTSTISSGFASARRRPSSRRTA